MRSVVAVVDDGVGWVYGTYRCLFPGVEREVHSTLARSTSTRKRFRLNSQNFLRHQPDWTATPSNMTHDMNAKTEKIEID